MTRVGRIRRTACALASGVALTFAAAPASAAAPHARIASRAYDAVTDFLHLTGPAPDLTAEQRATHGRIGKALFGVAAAGTVAIAAAAFAPVVVPVAAIVGLGIVVGASMVAGVRYLADSQEPVHDAPIDLDLEDPNGINVARGARSRGAALPEVSMPNEGFRH